jgi:hypothetical protein
MPRDACASTSGAGQGFHNDNYFAHRNLLAHVTGLDVGLYRHPSTAATAVDTIHTECLSARRGTLPESGNPWFSDMSDK